MSEPDHPEQAAGGHVRDATDPGGSLPIRLTEGERRFHGFAKAIWKVWEEEQRQLARELHDGLGQTLTALALQLERLRDKADATMPAELAARLGDSVEMARIALNESRELSCRLRPPVLDDFGLVAALSWLTRMLHTRAGLKVNLVLEGLDERLPPDIETLVFRLLEEALNNVLRHAGVDRAGVSLTRDGERLTLRVSDAGRGFDPSEVLSEGSPGSGLRVMRDRLELFGGSLELVSSPGAGTSLSSEILLTEAV